MWLTVACHGLGVIPLTFRGLRQLRRPLEPCWSNRLVQQGKERRRSDHCCRGASCVALNTL